MVIIVEQAIVYRANGRRYLTKRAAYASLVNARIRQRCDCEPDVGHQCYLHTGDHFLRDSLVNRLYSRACRLFVRWDKLMQAEHAAQAVGL